MRIGYEATLDDVSEPVIRQYLRGRTFKRRKFTEPLYRGFIAAVAYHFVFAVVFKTQRPWWAYVAVFAVCCTFSFLGMRRVSRDRIRSYVKRESAHRLPVRTSFEVTDTHLHCQSLKADISFNLDDVTEINDDALRIEIVFGESGLCTIPVRVFRDEEERREFLAMVGRERRG